MLLLMWIVKYLKNANTEQDYKIRLFGKKDKFNTFDLGTQKENSIYRVSATNHPRHHESRFITDEVGIRFSENPCKRSWFFRDAPIHFGPGYMH